MKLRATKPTAKTDSLLGGSANQGAGPLSVYAGQSVASMVSSLNRWRERYDPLVGFTIARARYLKEASILGLHAEPQWTFWNMERAYPTLGALIERRMSALVELDWNIRTIPEEKLPKGCTAQEAEEQQAWLRQQYERLDNLTDSIAALALASFRGFSVLQLQTLMDPDDPESERLVGAEAAVLNEGSPLHLESLNGWNLIRDGLAGSWFWNPLATMAQAWSLPKENRLDPRYFVMRTVPRPINLFALPLFCRVGLGEKDWSAFTEIYGIPGTTVIAPSNVPAAQVAAFEASANQIAEGGSGMLPNGSDVKYATPPHQGAPFRDFLTYQHEQLVLAGTGGQLTMLSQNTGIGKGSTDAHEETFAKIARSEAKLGINQPLNEHFDRRMLRAKFPGRPMLAYFQLAANEDQSTSEFVEEVGKLSLAGYAVDASEITEKVGYEVTLKATPEPLPVADPANPDAPRSPLPAPRLSNRLTNAARRAALSADRATLAVINRGRAALAEADQAELKPLRDRLSQLEGITNDAAWHLAATSLVTDLRNPESALRKSLGDVTASAEVLGNSISAALANGLAAGAVEKPKS